MKVYLSVNKQVKSEYKDLLIRKAEHNFTTCTYYKGGQYSDAELLDSHLVIVLTHSTPTDTSSISTLFVGKGVYTEVTKARRNNIPCFIVREIEHRNNEKDIWLSEITEIALYYPDDWVRTYGLVTFNISRFYNINNKTGLSKAVVNEHKRLVAKNTKVDQSTRTIYSTRKRKYLLISKFI